MKPTCLILKTAKLCHKVLYFQRSSFQTFVKGHSHFTKQRSNGNFLLSWVHYSKRPKNLNITASENIGSQSSDPKDPVETQFSKASALLRDSGVETQDIEKYYDILQDGDSYIKVSCLVQIKENPTELLPLLKLPEKILRAMVKQSQKDKKQISDFKDRMTYLQFELEVNHDKLIDLIMEQTLLLTLPFPKLNERMQILKRAKISAQHITENMFVFKFNESLLCDLIQYIVIPFSRRGNYKTQEEFNASVLREKEIQSILQGENKYGYLAKRLGCSEDRVKRLAETRLYFTKDALELKEILDFLFQKGYTSEQILSYLRIFRSSLEMLQERFVEFEKTRGKIPALKYLSP